MEIYKGKCKLLEHVFRTNIKSQFSYIDPNTLIVYENNRVPIRSITNGNFLLLRIPSNTCDCYDPLFSKILDFKKNTINIDLLILTSNKYDFRKFYSLKNETSNVKLALLFDTMSGLTADEVNIPTLVFCDKIYKSFKYYSFLKNDTIMLQTFLNCVHTQIIN